MGKPPALAKLVELYALDLKLFEPLANDGMPAKPTRIGKGLAVGASPGDNADIS